MGTTFSTNDDPGNPRQVNGSKGFQQGLKGEKANGRRRRGKVANAGAHRAVFYGNATPDMGRRSASLIPAPEVVPHPQAALCEHLIDMAVHCFHLRKDLINKRSGNVFVKEISHGIHKDHPWLAPLRRLIQPRFPEAQIKALPIGMARDATPAFRKALRIAVVAPS